MSMSGSRAATPEESAEHDRVVQEEREQIEAARAGTLIDTSAVKGSVKRAADSNSGNQPGPTAGAAPAAHPTP